MPTRRITATFAASLALAAGAAAAGADIRAFDRNGDRFITYEELIKVAPGATRSDFAAIDRNGDRRISANEFGTSRAQALVTRHATAAGKAAARLPVVPLTVADVDADRDGRVSFAELGRADALSLPQLRGN